MSAITCYDCKISVLEIIQKGFVKNVKLMLKAKKEIISNQINSVSRLKLKHLLKNIKKLYNVMADTMLKFEETQNGTGSFKKS